MTSLTSTTVTLLAALSLTAACASDDAPHPGETSNTGGSGSTSTTSGAGGGTDGGAGGGTDGGAGGAEPPPCGTAENGTCVPSGFPFASGAFAHSYSCDGICDTEPGPFGHPPREGVTISLTQPESGTLCLAGENPAEYSGIEVGLSVVRLREDGDVEVVEIFNADLLRITQMRFTIDRPPSTGVFLSVSTLAKRVCHDAGDCLIFGFAPPEPFTESGRVTLAFDDLTHPYGLEFDTRAIAELLFDVGPGGFDFCISDLEFLDADGNVVSEP